MLFCLSLCDDTRRVILDSDYYGDVLAVIEAKTWREARRDALKNEVLDSFIYRRGYGWERRNQTTTEYK